MFSSQILTIYTSTNIIFIQKKNRKNTWAVIFRSARYGLCSVAEMFERSNYWTRYRKRPNGQPDKLSSYSNIVERDLKS